MIWYTHKHAKVYSLPHTQTHTLYTTRNIYSFSRLLKHDFDRFVLFFNTPHTISTTTHPMSKTPQILCKIKHYCKNYTLIYQNHILLSNVASVANYSILFVPVTHCCCKPKTLLAILLLSDYSSVSEVHRESANIQYMHQTLHKTNAAD